MLSHHSGLHNFNVDSLYFTYFTRPQSEAAMLLRMQSEKPDFEPGAKAEYSNTNFLLLGYIIEKITGKPYAEELRARITAKAGLADTYYGGKTNTANNEAYSYIFAGGWRQQPETDMSIPGGAGALVSTPSDLAKFAECLFNGKLISQASINQMTTMYDDYGMGIFTMPFNNKKGFGHTGSIDGFTSILSYFPDEKLAIAYITNGGAYSINDVTTGALSICFNQPFKLPSFQTFTLKPEQLDKYLGTYTCPKSPLKVTIIKSGNTLIAQYEGVKEFALDPVGVDQFLCGNRETTVFFNADRNEFTAMQGDKKYLYTRVK
jgi:CubicO group peptidase (beta-lactamase class C family)